jgi:integrase
MWQAWLGPGGDPHTISLREWEGFISARAAGEISARGVRTDDQNPVRPRTVEADCDWLRTVFSWAVDWRLKNGGYLMRENPVRGYRAPAEKNPRRAVATQDRFEIVRAISDEFGYLSEILDLANDTGRRISSICKFLYSDLIVNEHGRFVSIRWRAETDKTGHESIIPITEDAGAALTRVQQARPGIGDTHIFPAPGNPQRPISRHLADSWLRKAEKKAGLSPLEGTLWHAYRRKWVTERKHLPDVDVAAAGGWQNTDTLKLAYQHADHETLRQVVMEPRRLRDAQ